jgi:3-oxoacyl-[acyl-carrier-protein] synthase III
VQCQSKVLVIGADTMSSIIDYTDRATCVLFGDNAGAVFIEPAEENELGLIDFTHEIDSRTSSLLQWPCWASVFGSHIVPRVAASARRVPRRVQRSHAHFYGSRL